MTVVEDVPQGVLKDPSTESDNSMVETKTEHAPEAASNTSPELKEPAETESSPRSVHGWKWVAAIGSLYVAALVYGLDGTIAADIQPAIIENFNTVQSLTWIGTAFPLGSVCSILPIASLYAIFDAKRMFIASIILFETGSVICGAAPSMAALIVGRSIAGVGGTGLFLGCLNYISFCTTERERGPYMSGMGVVWGLGAVLGPVVGGAFSTSSATWRWAFYINLVIAAVCAPSYVFYLPSIKPAGATDTPVLRKLQAMDWLGYLLGTGGMVSLTIALTFAGSTWDWGDGRTIATLVVAGVLFILTFLQQYFVLFTTHETRMFPPKHTVFDRTQILLNITTAMAVAGVFVPVYYLPIYFAFTRGDSALMSAVRLLPFICVTAVCNMTAGVLLTKVKYYWAIYLTSGILMTIGGATLYTVTPDTPTQNVYGYSVLLAAGTGLILNSGFTVAGISMMKKTGSGRDVQHAVFMQNLSQLGFETMSLLMGGQIFQSLSTRDLTRILDGLGFSKADITSAIAGTQSTLFASLSPTLQAQAIEAITNAMSKVYILCIAAGALTIISAALMKKERLI